MYAVQFYALGVPITIEVDDLLPVDKKNEKSTWFASVGDDGSIWAPIIEKAFAKFHGSYARTILGDAIDGIATLNGSPNMKIDHKKDSIEDLWRVLSTYDTVRNRGFLIAITPGEDDRKTNAQGLRQSHSYTILGV